MGLELVEIVVDLERRFKISIADDDAVKFETVGDIYRYIIDRSKEKYAEYGSYCQGREVFYRIRKALIEVLKSPRNRIKPSTPLENIIPKEERSQYIEKLEFESGLKFPDLEWTKSGFRYDTNLSCLLALVLSILIPLILYRQFPWLSIITWFVAGLFALIPLTRLFRKLLPTPELFNEKHKTLRDLIDDIVYINDESIGKVTTNKVEIIRIVKRVIIDQLGVDEEQVVPQARLAEDLGVG